MPFLVLRAMTHLPLLVAGKADCGWQKWLCHWRGGHHCQEGAAAHAEDQAAPVSQSGCKIAIEKTLPLPQLIHCFISLAAVSANHFYASFTKFCSWFEG